MLPPMPTRVDDVLILSTAQSFTIYAVGQVSKDGQQGFDAAMSVKYVTTETAARAEAQALAKAKGRIFLRNIDTRKWADISDRVTLPLPKRTPTIPHSRQASGLPSSRIAP